MKKTIIKVFAVAFACMLTFTAVGAANKVSTGLSYTYSGSWKKDLLQESRNLEVLLQYGNRLVGTIINMILIVEKHLAGILLHLHLYRGNYPIQELLKLAIV